MDVNQRISLANWIGGRASPNGEQSAARITDGVATSSSSRGTVSVRLGSGEGEDAEGPSVECRTIGKVHEGDRVEVLMQDGDPLVLGKAGWGDGMSADAIGVEAIPVSFIEAL